MLSSGEKASTILITSWDGWVIGHRISAIRSHVKGASRFWIGLEDCPALWLAIPAFHRASAVLDAATACRVRIRRQPGDGPDVY